MDGGGGQVIIVEGLEGDGLRLPLPLLPAVWGTKRARSSLNNPVADSTSSSLDVGVETRVRSVLAVANSLVVCSR